MKDTKNKERSSGQPELLLRSVSSMEMRGPESSTGHPVDDLIKCVVSVFDQFWDKCVEGAAKQTQTHVIDRHGTFELSLHFDKYQLGVQLIHHAFLLWRC